MSDHGQSSADSVISDILRWPVEGWTKRKISFLLQAHRVHYRYSDTRPELLDKLLGWAQTVDQILLRLIESRKGAASSSSGHYRRQGLTAGRWGHFIESGK
ncbi:uncharacterized protein RSE6_03201 [Rhynchosporium secalis]|uniref:Uncharacterized protein n=1 Tax=Rhynchosporium secalis TaxID=38038 RepID=A0A1E1M268_RHYSE|nr:uncharacterized protein RSE6_03201 [Rhynchosporium secalis]